MLKRLFSTLVLAFLASTLTGCGSNPVVNGAAVGGLIGVIAGDTGKAAARGAVAGAIIGGLLGSSQQQPTVQAAPALAPTQVIPSGRAVCPLPNGQRVWANSYPECLTMQREVAGGSRRTGVAFPGETCGSGYRMNSQGSYMCRD